MVKTKSLIFVVLLSSLFLFTACNSNGGDSAKLTIGDDSKTRGSGKELLFVGAEYAYCYDTGAYDPTQRYNCELQLSYKECLEWAAKQEGTGQTEFKATFIGGEPTIPGRTANEYYMKVIYADGKESTTDTRAVFKEYENEFTLFVDDNCYPNATIEIYNVDDKLMDSKSFDYSKE